MTISLQQSEREKTDSFVRTYYFGHCSTRLNPKDNHNTATGGEMRLISYSKHSDGKSCATKKLGAISDFGNYVKFFVITRHFVEFQTFNSSQTDSPVNLSFLLSEASPRKSSSQGTSLVVAQTTWAIVQSLFLFLVYTIVRCLAMSGATGCHLC